jgi:hypothetical protein
MSPRRLATSLCSIAAVALLATACGDDPADGTAAGSGTSESTLPSSEGAPTGSGSIAIEGVTYAFDADICSLTPVNHEARDFQLYVRGTGTQDDLDYEVEVFRTVSASGNQIETINFNPGEGQLAAATNSVSDASPARLEVSASVLTGEMDFVATAEDLPLGAGTVGVTCS